VNTIAASTRFHVSSLKESMSQMSSTITALALHNNDTWPFVTVPAFEVLGEGARHQAGVETIIFAPLVRREDYDQWGRYSVEHYLSWFNESRNTMISSDLDSLVASDYISGSPRKYIFDSPRTAEEIAAQGVLPTFTPSIENYDGPYLPYW
jgi:hypothetical protein